MSRSYTEGYHGTDELTARRLVEDGFDTGYPNELYLAAPYQTYLAHMHGVKNAERSGSTNYAILKTVFPDSRVQIGYLGPESIRFYDDDIDKVAIVGLSIFTRKGELVEGNPVEITNET